MVLYQRIPPRRCGGIGRRTGLKIPRRKSYGFDPRHRYHVRRSKHRSVSAKRRKLHYVSSFFLSKSNPLYWASIWFLPSGANTVPFPPNGENCTMLAPSSFPNRTRSAGLRFGFVWRRCIAAFSANSIYIISKNGGVSLAAGKAAWTLSKNHPSYFGRYDAGFYDRLPHRHGTRGLSL